MEAGEFSVNKPVEGLTGLKLMDISLKDNMLVCSVQRGDRSFIPDGKDTIELGDRVIVVTTHLGLNDIKDILKD